MFVGCETQQEIDQICGAADRRRRHAEPLRLAEGQVRAVLADRAELAGADAGARPIPPGRPRTLNAMLGMEKLDSESAACGVLTESLAR